MSRSNLYRCSALALVVSAVLDAIAVPLKPSSFAPNAVLSAGWTPVLLAGIIAFLFSLPAIVGVYVRQSERAGILGLAAFGLSLCATALFVGVFMVQAFVLPTIAAQPNAAKTANELLGPGGPLAAFFPFSLFGFLLFDIGFILFGISIVRAGVLPRGSGWLMVFGTFLVNAQIAGPVGEYVSIAGAWMFDLAFIWLASALWSEQREPQRVIRTTAV
jgi:hypothetical protein